MKSKWKHTVLFLAALLVMLLGTSGLAFAWTLSGTVYGGSTPMSGATVKLSNAADATAAGTVSTTATGGYSLTVADGSYNMTITPATGSGFSESVVNGIVISGGDVVQNVVLMSQTNATVSGVVRAPDGTGISNLYIRIINQTTSLAEGTAVTDANGAFTSNVTSGTYCVLVESYGTTNVPTPNSFYYRLWSDQVISGAFSLPRATLPLVTLNGKTTNSSGDAVANAQVARETKYNSTTIVAGYYKSTIYSQTVNSDASGGFKMTLFSDSYNFTVTPPTGSGYLTTAIKDLSVTTDVTTNLVLRAPDTSVSGVVRAPSGTGISNLRVKVVDQASGLLQASAITDANGAFTIGTVAGTYVIVVENYGTTNIPTPSSFYYRMWSNQTVTGPTTLPYATLPLVTLTGKTTTSDGSFIPAVQLYRSFNYNQSSYLGGYYVSVVYGQYVNSNATGDYSMTLLANTGYSFTATPGSGSTYGSASFSNIGVQADTSYNFSLPAKSSSISGSVTNPAGTGISNLRVSASDQSNLTQATAITDANGAFTMNVPSGTYRVLVESYSTTNVPTPNNFSYRIWSNQVVSGATTLPGVALPIVSLSGKTTDSVGVGIQAVQIYRDYKYIYDSYGYNIGYVSTQTVQADANGSYSMTVLGTSNYGLTITPPTGSGFGTLRLTTDITTNVRQNIILALPDTKAPVILTGPTVASKTDTTATIQWQTDEPAKGGAVYGMSDPPGTAAAEASFSTTHSMQLTGLTANTTYYVRVNATDLYGNGPTTSTVISFTTMPTSDKTPPVIVTGPTVSSITQSSAVVEWTTDEPTTGGVIYGLTATPDQTVSDTVASATHRITLTGLSSETDYYFKVTATDTAGNGPVSATGTSFRTLAAPDTAAPVITEGPMVTSVSDTGATVVWVTDEPATSGVSFNDGVAHGVYNDDTLTTSHSATLTGLSASKIYNFTVSSKDAFSNGPALSKEVSFTTKDTPDTAAPVFTQIPIVKNTTHQSVVLYWETDEGAACTIQYGTSESFGLEDAKTELNTVHNRALTGLLPGTLYYFRVVANDAAKNTVTSKIYSFKTELIPDTNPPVITKEAAVIYSNDKAATIAFETDKPCDTVIKYGPNGSIGLQKSNSDKVNEHQVTLTNLEGNTSYTVQVSCTDMSGNTVVASAGTPSTYLAMNYAFILSDAVVGAAGNGFMTKSDADTTAPVITEIPQAIAVTSNMVRIHWLTDEIADSQVLYALQGQPLTSAAGSIVKSAGHSVALTNLQAGTTYQFKIRSTDPAGNTTESGVYSFTTAAVADTTPPVISAISALGGDRKIDVKWNTDEPSTTVLRYGTSPLALTGQVSVSGSRTSHAVTLYNLVPGTTYYVAPQAVDGSGNSTQGGTQQLTLSGAAPTSFTVTATAGSGGTIAPASQQVFSGYQLALAVQPAQGYLIKSVAGCGGALSGNVFTTAAITGSCAVSAAFTPDPAQVVPLTSAAKPAPGTYSGGTLLVRLSASRPGATIYYTTDGTTPLLSPKTYSGPIAVTGTQTVKFLAKDDFDTEAVNSATYTVNTDGQPSATYDGKSGSSFTVTRQSTTGSATVYSGTQKSFTDSGTLTPNTIYTYSVASDSEGATELMSVRTPLYTGWNIVAVPFDLASGISPSSLFGSQVSAVYQWTPSGATAEDSPAVLGSYKNVTTLLPGYGYFVKAGTAGTTFAYSGSSAPQSVDVILKPGWTMIANPNSTVKTDIATNWLVDGSPLGTAVVANKIGGGIYWWNGTTYDSWSIVSGNPQIEPWKGYWILNLDSVNHTLTITQPEAK